MNRSLIRSPRRAQGFTLIELLVVIAIIGILAAVLIPSYAASQKRPYDVAALQCGHALVAAELTYSAEHGGTHATSVSQLNNGDVTEQCQNVSILSDGGGIPAQSGAPNNLITTADPNYAFFVYSPSGSSVYYYNQGGSHFQKMN